MGKCLPFMHPYMPRLAHQVVLTLIGYGIFISAKDPLFLIDLFVILWAVGTCVRLGASTHSRTLNHICVRICAVSALRSQDRMTAKFHRCHVHDRPIEVRMQPLACVSASRSARAPGLVATFRNVPSNRRDASHHHAATAEDPESPRVNPLYLCVILRAGLQWDQDGNPPWAYSQL